VKEIAKNEYYDLYYEECENCIYWTMKGFWQGMSVVPNFHKDWDKARKLTKQGWKLYSDVSQCKVVPQDVGQEKIKNQKESMESGCIKIARIVDSAITKMSLHKEINELGMDEVIKEFNINQVEEAKKWLNN